MARLLKEFIGLQYDKTLIKEAKETKQPIIVKGLLQRADEVNQNGRIYPMAILQREVENYKKAIAEGRATAELDHPDSSIVSLENVSHVLRDIWWEGNEVWGKLEILNTPKGRIAQDLMEAGIKLGISSRGVGEINTDDDGNDVVEENYMLICFDLVSEPSTQNAWVMKEGKELKLQEVRKLIPKVDRVNRIVNEILRTKRN